MEALGERLDQAWALCALLEADVLAVRLTRLSRLLDEVGALRSGDAGRVPEQRTA